METQLLPLSREASQWINHKSVSSSSHAALPPSVICYLFYLLDEKKKNLHALPLCFGKQSTEPTSRPKHHAFILFFLFFYNKTGWRSLGWQWDNSIITTWRQQDRHIVNRWLKNQEVKLLPYWGFAIRLLYNSVTVLMWIKGGCFLR